MVVGITRCLNEADIIEASLRHMLTQVPHVIVGEGHSTDGTREIIESLITEGLAITLLDDTSLNWQQREVLTGYAHQAREQHGATWITPFDIDELWYADGMSISDALNDLPDHFDLARVSLLNHTRTTEDDDHPNPFVQMRWRSAQVLPLPKVACRTRPDLHIDHGNHGAWFSTMGRRQRPAWANGILEARHYPYRSPEQLIKRVTHAWPMLRDSGLPRSHGQHMWEYGELYDREGDDGLRRLFFAHMCKPNPSSDPELVLDPAPCLASV